jgi:hypothetical protein
MKKLIFICIVSTIGIFGAKNVSAQELLHSGTSLNSSNAEIKFEKETHDFGKIKQHSDATYHFKFTNTGKEPLIITDAKGSCDCTVPEWPKQPIRPGESATIKVKYDSKKVGLFNKTVTITSNAKNESVSELKIMGTVEPAEKK